LYTDGITEAENMDGEQYELERLCEIVSRHWQKEAEAIKNAVIANLRAFIGQQKVHDDITLLVLKQK
ncbi:MAG: PP2C family protein-serine/threonine phosphatase, partial [Ardenticatenaceae bacterium]